MTDNDTHAQKRYWLLGVKRKYLYEKYFVRKQRIHFQIQKTYLQNLGLNGNVLLLFKDLVHMISFSLVYKLCHSSHWFTCTVSGMLLAYNRK